MVPGSAPPIIVTNGAAVTGVNVVLHDRDTDGDRLPDVWEWSRFGNLAKSGYDSYVPGSNELPDGFRLLEYVESTGAQYVDTGVSYSAPIEFSAVVATTVPWNNNNVVYGASTVSPRLFTGWSSATKINLGMGGGVASPAHTQTIAVEEPFSLVVRHAGQRSMILNGEAVWSGDNQPAPTNTIWVLGSRRGPGESENLMRSGDSFKGRLYSFQIRSGNDRTLVRDYLPVSDANGVAGLWDRVSRQFFPSATETPLAAGPERQATASDPGLWEAYAALPYSDPDALADWIWPIDWTQVFRRAAATAVKEALRVRVESPRTFLHEGDLLAPYILRDRSPDAKDEPANRLYRLWRGQEVDGVQTWIPQTEPYLGFNLGSHSNIVVTWTVEASDGSSSAEIATGSFPVRSEIGEARMPATSRYPVQNEKVRTSVVEFQWTMDECNAGVVFDVWKVSGPEGTKDDADAVFNSVLIYELAVIKQFAEPLLFNVRQNEPEYYEAKRLLKFLEYFVGVDTSTVPGNSLLREFVGGSCFPTG